MKKISVSADTLRSFDRKFFASDEVMTRIGTGSIGGKASGLAFIKDMLTAWAGHAEPHGFTVSIPRLTVLATDAFDRFMESNDLYEAVATRTRDDLIAHAFQRADLPYDLVGDLRALIESVRTPLAVRSSSLLEDAMYEPFAGVYATKMIPNNQSDADTRFRKLVEAIKYVYASTFFEGARDYIAATGKSSIEEKMAVIIQEVVGTRFGERFYPHISGVGRSYNFYPVGKAKPGDGVVNLALGLGKTIVDGALNWTYSPAYPKIIPPVGSPGELLKLTQTRFWAVNMGRPPEYDPIRETEYLVHAGLEDAERDGTLRFVASTYRPQDDRLVPGTGADGPRVLTFAPILAEREIPVNELVVSLLRLCEEAVGNPVEIEFAITLNPKDGVPARFGFLQVRPMVVSDERIEIADDEMAGEKVLAASDRVMGNGEINTLEDIVYVRPDVFEARHTPAIVEELARFNRALAAEKRRYLLIGFGRWGSSEPWLGIPVEWGQVSNAGAIIEATLPDMDVELSQGSHFFHNISSFRICYFMVQHTGMYHIDWEWLVARREVGSGRFVRHVRAPQPLTIKVDGRTGRGVIMK